MSLSSRIKGITIEIGADTTKLSSALNQANRSIRDTQRSLNDVNRALKLDPGNSGLLSDKFSMLKNNVGETQKKLEALKQAQVQLDGQGVDKNTKEYRDLQTEIHLTEAKLKQLQKETRLFGSVGAQQVAAVGEKMKTVGANITSAGRTMTMGVTVPLVAGGTAAVTKFAEVDKTMTLTNETMKNSAEDAKRLDRAMKDAAMNSTFGMSDAATASLNFARAGLSAKEAAATLAPAMNLAAGEGGNLEVVSAGLVGTINGFGDTFDNAGKYADVFANACNNSALDIDSLSDSMSIAAPVFRAAGYNVNDAALYMGVMADSGIEASEAANALKTGMARLVAPKGDAPKWMERLGISITDANGKMKDSVTVQRELHTAFAGLSESEQIAAASAIFGKNQMSKWLALINSSPEKVQELSGALEKQGTTAEMAEAMMSGFGGSLTKLKSSIDVAAVSFGEALAPAISKIAEVIQNVVNWFNGLDEKQQQMIATIALVVAAIGPLLLIIGQVITVIGTIMSAAGALGGAIAALSGPIGWIALAIGAVIAIGVALWQNWDTIKQKAGELLGAIGEKFNAIKETVSNALSGAKEAVTKKWNDIANAVKNSRIGQVTKATWDAVKKTATDSMSAIKSAYDKHGGGMTGAAAAMMEGIKQWYMLGFNFLDNLTGGKLSSIAKTFNDKMSNIARVVGEKIGAVKNFFQNGLQAAANVVNNVMNAIVGFFRNGIATAFETVNNYMLGIHKIFCNVFSAISKVTSGTINWIIGFFNTGFSNIFTTVNNILQGVHNVFVNKLTAVWNFVQNIISSIKNLFSFDLQLGIKLPHLSMDPGKAPYGIGGKGHLPSFGVEWYDKGGIFNSPSIIGVGEKRPEFVGALDDLRKIVREESGGGSQMNTLISLMTQMVDEVRSMRSLSVTQNIYADDTSYSGQQRKAAQEMQRIARLI